MPKLTPESESIRRTQAVQVLALQASEQISQADACRQVGITPDIYRRWIAENDEALDTIKTLVEAVHREELAMITMTQQRILQRLIERATTGAIETKDLIAAATYLDKKAADLNRGLQLEKTTDTAMEYLKGPNTKSITSRQGSRAGTVNVKPREDGSVDIAVETPENVIDGEFADD